MRLLLLNPNTSESLTERMIAVAREVAARDTDLVAWTAPRGFPYISSRAEACISATFVLEAIAEHADAVDAVVIAAFGDPGLVAARELFDVPITGMADASMLTACALGERFAIVTFSGALSPWYHDGVVQAGLTGRFAGVHVPQGAFSSVDSVQEELADPLADLAADAAHQHNANVAILAGAPLAGLAPRLADRLPIPAIDPVQAAVLQAELLVRLQPAAARVGSFARPRAKSSKGVSPALAQYIQRTDQSGAADC